MEMRLTIIYEQAGDLMQALVAELPGAISLGKTKEEARANLAEAIEMVLAGLYPFTLHSTAHLSGAPLMSAGLLSCRFLFLTLKNDVRSTTTA